MVYLTTISCHGHNYEDSILYIKNLHIDTEMCQHKHESN